MNNKSLKFNSHSLDLIPIIEASDRANNVVTGFIYASSNHDEGAKEVLPLTHLAAELRIETNSAQKK